MAYMIVCIKVLIKFQVFINKKINQTLMSSSHLHDIKSVNIDNYEYITFLNDKISY